MIAFDPNSGCERAEQYYYDFLIGSAGSPIPEPVVQHLDRCEYCRQQIQRLEQVLSGPGSEAEPARKRVNWALSTMLRLHFAYIGKQVTCDVVRPFLPTLLDSSLEVRIPTPITTHLDNCRQCSADLEAIRSLNLDRQQLRRLSELCAEAIPRSPSLCPEDRKAAASVAAMDFGAAGPEKLNHLCMCPVGRGLVRDERQKIIEGLGENVQSAEFLCDAVSSADLFDYVVPYGLDPATDQYREFRKAFTSHALTCRKCLGKMQQLHDLLYGIVGRPESGVITVYNVEGSPELSFVGRKSELYSDFPIAVEVRQPKDTASSQDLSSTLDLNATLGRGVLRTNVKPLVKVGLAAAAVVLIAVALFVTTPATHAVTVQQIFGAIQKAKHAYIGSFVPGKSEPVQEQWVSRTLKVQLMKVEGRFFLWDLATKVRKTRYPESAEVETYSPTAEEISSVERTIAGFWGLVPFDSPSAIPAGSEWRRVSEGDLPIPAEDLETYELLWIERALDGSSIARKWKVFVEPGTALPQRTEFYGKSPSDTGFVLQSTRIVTCLGDNDFLTVLKEAFP